MNLQHDDGLVDLDRKPVLPSSQDDRPLVGQALFELMAEFGADETTWAKLLVRRRVVLLVGPAHCGKTSELRLLRRRLRGDNRVCFLLDMGIIVRASVDDALGAEAEELDEWLRGDKEAVILLDSLDEAQLCDERALTTCLSRVCRRLTATGVARCRFIISSRPGAWSTHDVLMEIREQLAAPVRRVASIGKRRVLLDEAADAQIEQDALCVASLPSLKPAQLETLLREVHHVEQPAKLLKRVSQLGLGFAVKSPGSLSWLVPAVLRVGEEAAGRFAGFEAAVSEQVRASYKQREYRVTVPEAEFVKDLELLCAAAHFGQTYMFALRSATDLDGAVSLREALVHREVRYEVFVQSSPFFIDAGPQRVKWLPDQLLQFLAARWLAARIDHGDITADEAFEQLFAQSSFNGEMVPSQLEVTAGWLASMNLNFAHRLISVAPHAALLYGDLGRLPLDVARAALAATLAALLRGQALFFRSVRLTPDDFWQAMRPQLTQQVVACFGEAQDNLEALDLLIRLVASRGIPEAMPQLRKVLANPNVPEQALPRLVDAIGECGTAEDVEWAIDELFRTGRMSSRVGTHAFDALLQRSTDASMLRKVIVTGWVEEIAASISADERILEEPNKDVAFALFVHLLAACTGHQTPSQQVKDRKQDLDQDAQLGDDLTGGLDAIPRVPMKVLASALRALLARHDLLEADHAQLLDWLEQLRTMHAGRDNDLFEEIDLLLTRLPVLRGKALGRLIRKVKPTELSWLNFHHEPVYAVPKPSDIPLLRQLQANAKDEEVRAELERLIDRLEPRIHPQQPHRPQRRQKEKQEATSAEVATVRERIEALRTASDVLLLIQLAQGAWQADEENLEHEWHALANTFGGEVLAAVREGLRRLWRTVPPLEKPDAPNEVYARTVTALVGLRDELIPGAAKGLSDAEATRALEYSVFEANSFPEWVAELVESRIDLCDAFFGKTIASWNASPAAQRHARDTIAWIPPRLAKEGHQCRAAAWAFWRAKAWEGYNGLERLLDLLCQAPEDPALPSELSQRAGQAWAQASEGWVALLSAWIRVAPAAAIQFLAKEATDPSRHADLITLASHWSLHSNFPLELHADSEELARHLEEIYVVIATAAPPATDPYRMGVYRPDSRDNAAQLRSSLLSMIEKIGGHSAYAALQRLASRFEADPVLASVFVTHAVRVAETSVLPAKWSTLQFVKFAHDAAQLPVSTEQALWKRVIRDIRAIVRNLETGRFHIGRLLAEGKEADMQLWLAREMELHSRGAYGLFREGELANRTKTDLVADAASRQVTLELKVGDDRTVESLLSDLEQQLLQDYLGDVRSNFGVFVVMVKDPGKTFPREGRQLSVRELGEALQVRAEELSRQRMGRKTFKVIVFSCPLQSSARARRRRKPEGK